MDDDGGLRLARNVYDIVVAGGLGKSTTFVGTDD